MRETKQNIAKTREKLKNQKSAEVSRQPYTASSAQTIMARQPAYRSAAVHTASKGTIKTADKSVKTADRTSKAAIKATQQTAKTTQKTVEATLKASQLAVQAAKVTARATVQTAKATAETLKSAVKAAAVVVKAIITETKALIAAIAAGGWIAVVVILIVCLAALIIGSCFGMFFSDEQTGSQNGMSLTSTIAQCNSDFTAKVTRIENENPHDEVDGVTKPQNWKDVLTVYAVKTSSDPNNPTVVSTMDDAKFADLKEVFWDMNSITGSTETLSPHSEKHTARNGKTACV